jgi:hypothetical protein
MYIWLTCLSIALVTAYFWTLEDLIVHSQQHHVDNAMQCIYIYDASFRRIIHHHAFAFYIYYTKKSISNTSRILRDFEIYYVCIVIITWQAFYKEKYNSTLFIVIYILYCMYICSIIA